VRATKQKRVLLTLRKLVSSWFIKVEKIIWHRCAVNTTYLCGPTLACAPALLDPYLRCGEVRRSRYCNGENVSGIPDELIWRGHKQIGWAEYTYRNGGQVGEGCKSKFGDGVEAFPSEKLRRNFRIQMCASLVSVPRAFTLHPLQRHPHCYQTSCANTTVLVAVEAFADLLSVVEHIFLVDSHLG
jgi:hypothetical protein